MNPKKPFQMNDPKAICCTPNRKSIIKTTNAITNDATETTTALFCNSAQLGQVTLCINSSYDSRMYPIIFFIFNLILAGEERFELPSMVLETTILPLNYSPKKDTIKVSFILLLNLIFQLPDLHLQFYHLHG